MEGIIEITGQEKFNLAIKKGLTVVDFWATWCMPCQMQAPVLAELKDEYKDKINVIKVNVDEEANEPIATSLDIVSIPTLAFYLDGELKEKVVGLTRHEELKEIIGKYDR